MRNALSGIVAFFDLTEKRQLKKLLALRTLSSTFDRAVMVGLKVLIYDSGEM